MIKESEWRSALESAMKGSSSDGATVKEMSHTLSHSDTWVRDRLQILNKDGKIVVSYRTVLNLVGTACRVPCYKIKK